MVGLLGLRGGPSGLVGGGGGMGAGDWICWVVGGFVGRGGEGGEVLAEGACNVGKEVGGSVLFGVVENWSKSGAFVADYVLMCGMDVVRPVLDLNCEVGGLWGYGGGRMVSRDGWEVGGRGGFGGGWVCGDLGLGEGVEGGWGGGLLEVLRALDGWANGLQGGSGGFRVGDGLGGVGDSAGFGVVGMAGRWDLVAGGWSDGGWGGVDGEGGVGERSWGGGCDWLGGREVVWMDSGASCGRVGGLSGCNVWEVGGMMGYRVEMVDRPWGVLWGRLDGTWGGGCLRAWTEGLGVGAIGGTEGLCDEDLHTECEWEAGVKMGWWECARFNGGMESVV
ncbi:hypothetical protein Tco_0497358 [Tanacetum coccineum]